MSYIDQYRSKLVSPEDAVKVVKSGDWIEWGTAMGHPYALDKALADRKDELIDIKIRSTLSLKEHEIWKQDPNGETFTFNSWYFGGIDRKYHDKGLVNCTPMLFRNEPLFYRKFVSSRRWQLSLLQSSVILVCQFDFFTPSCFVVE